MTDNREYRARIHIMVDDIESNHRLRQLHALIYRKQIEREKSRAGGTLSEDEWSDLVCLGTSYGQAQGFESGFRYDLALIFESLSN